jgi:radial spoke head protein 4A
MPARVTGVGVGEEESFRVMLALKQLAANFPVTDIHFWGKIFGLEKDYLIAQCVYKEGEEPQVCLASCCVVSH